MDVLIGIVIALAILALLAMGVMIVWETAWIINEWLRRRQR